MQIHQFWNIFTDILVVISIVVFVGFVCLAIKQWSTRKKFTLIDRELRWAIFPFSLLAIVYLVFEKLWILSLRPLASGKPWEPSFPSTHTMLIATIFFVTIILLPKYLKSARARLILDLLMIVAVIAVAIGRVLANMHWPTDVIGGLLFAGLFADLYNLTLRYTEPKSTHPRRSHKTHQGVHHAKHPKT